MRKFKSTKIVSWHYILLFVIIGLGVYLYYNSRVREGADYSKENNIDDIRIDDIRKTNPTPGSPYKNVADRVVADRVVADRRGIANVSEIRPPSEKLEPANYSKYSYSVPVSKRSSKRASKYPHLKINDGVTVNIDGDYYLATIIKKPLSNKDPNTYYVKYDDDGSKELVHASLFTEIRRINSSQNYQ
jgi:hypothetical protein